MPPKVSTPKNRPTPAKEDNWQFDQFVAPSVRPTKSSSSRAPLIITLLIVLIVLAVVALYLFKFPAKPVSAKYQAVYLDTGQVYYAKVIKEDAYNVYLDDVYYIQSQEQTIPATEEGKEPTKISVPMLVSRSDELQKPEGYLQINRSKVIAIETIGDDSKIVEEIYNLKKK